MTDLADRIADLSPERRALLALRLQKKRAETRKQPEISRRKEPESYPLSFGQERMWFLDQLEPGSSFYNIPAAVRLDGVVDFAFLEQSLNDVLQRHEILRSFYITQNGEPVQRIKEKLFVPLQTVDLSQLLESVREDQALQLATEEARRPFDLTVGPLLRATLIRISERVHLFVLVMHHIVADGWSMGVLIREVTMPYQASSKRLPFALPELAIQYADYALWQREWLQGENLDAQLSYWKDQLGDPPPALELYPDRPRPQIQTYRGTHLFFQLSLELTRALKQLSRDESVTLFMVFLAAFDVLLYRYTGQEDLLVGTPVANRSRPEIEGLIGFFVNTLVLRNDLTGDPKFLDFLGRVRKVALDGYTHQDLPFEYLIKALNPERDLGHTPVFQVMFDLQDSAIQKQEMPGLTLSPVYLETGTVKFDLSLSMEERETGMIGWFEYNQDLFDTSTIDRLCGHFKTILEGIAQNPSQRISKLPMLTRLEEQQLLDIWNGNRFNIPEDLSALRLFEEQARRTPDSVALLMPGDDPGQPVRTLTYQELNRRANQLAHYLKKIGVGPDILVGICVERSIEMVLGLMGILKAGGGYLPLDPNYPIDRLAFMLADSAARVLLVQDRLAARLPESDQLEVIRLDGDWDSIARECDENPPVEAAAENLAYVIYTSGSTGRPKGVDIPQRALTNYILSAREKFSLCPEDRVLQFASISFDAAAEEIFPCLSSGATLVLRTDPMLSSTPVFLTRCDELRISVLDLPTAFWHQLVTDLESSPVELPASLRLVIIGGERALPERLRAWHEIASSRIRLLNTYGPTETTIVATQWELGDLTAPAAQLREVPIGRPVPNLSAYVLDKNLNPAPVGVPGELYIGGAGLARGYRNRPDLTAEKFICDPFSPVTGARLYRTGDLARILSDGNLEYLGRVDQQVKIRGFRVELGEIEASLRRHPALRDAVVTVREDIPGEKRLAAYILPVQSPAPSTGVLRAYLRESLPEYMLPAYFIEIDTLPLTPGGKVNTRALPVPSGERPDLEKAFLPPRTLLERALAGMWQDLLRIEQAGVRDSFFELGGDSLRAAVFTNRLQKELGEVIYVVVLFDALTIEGLAAYLNKKHPSAVSRWLRRQFPGSPEMEIEPVETQENPQVIHLQPVPKTKDLPLSFAQQRLWFLDQLEPGSPFYNIPAAVRIQGRLEVQPFEWSLNEVIRRHDILRTNFYTVEGHGVQRVARQRSITVPLEDLSHLPPEEQALEVQRKIQAYVQQPFNLSEGSLIRASLLRLNDEDHIALLTMHHIISDGWSIGILVREIAALYEAYLEGKPSPLQELAIQYADYTVWQRQWLEGDVLERQLSYWKQQLAGLPPLLELPTDRPRPAVQTFRGAIQEFEWPTELTGRVKNLSQATGVTLFMTLLAIYQVLLYRYTGQDDFAVGTPIANRNREEFEGLIGFFVNTLVVRADLSAEPTFKDLLERVRKAAREAYGHQELPFEMLVDALQLKRDLSHSPLFQVVFTLQSSPFEPVRFEGLTISAEAIDSGTAKFDLTLIMDERDGKLYGEFEYNTDLFNRETIERMVGHFQTLADEMSAHPDEPVSKVGLLTDAERHLLLQVFNATGAADPEAGCAHHLFEAQVERAPQAIALNFEGQRLTYAELNRQANRLAYALQKRGVGPEKLVGICLDRSPEMLVALLGVLKAGGAYVPLDPNYPVERLSFMLEDSRAAVLVTQSPYLERLPEHCPEVVCLDREYAVLEQEPEGNPHSGAGRENLAYVIYTSGSTGKPKGTLLHHRGLVNLVAAYMRDFEIGPGSSVLQFFSFSFDGSVVDIFSALTSGATLALPRRDTARSMIDLHRFMQETGVTHVLMTPSALTVLPSQDLPSLRTVLAGAESCTAEVVARWAAGRCFGNAYGPTEATVASSWYLLGKQDNLKSIPIGRPIPNTQYYILDIHLQPVPVGVPGELFIGGTGVARGYLNRPEITAERFVPNPFSRQAGARMYRTGDLARYLPDGNVEFLGRIDNQVKVRGFRIELGEIEAALKKHRGVQDAVVVTREDRPGEKQLVAYLVANLATDLRSIEDLDHLTPPTDRRSEFRVNLRVPGELQTDRTGRQIVRTVNLSYNGAFLDETPEGLQVGQPVRLSLGLEEKDANLEREGVVVWVGERVARVQLETSPDQHSRLKQWFEQALRQQDFTVYDRRKAEFRVPLQLACRVEDRAGQQWQGKTRDLSFSGARLVGMPETWQTGAEVKLSLALLESDEPVKLWGQVIWREKGSAGLKFKPEEVERRRIRRYLLEYVGKGQLTVSDLRAYLKSHLADYMVPGVFVMLDEMPQLPNGKVDRRALAGMSKPERMWPELDEEYMAPQTDKEKLLAEIWRGVLGLEQVGVQDNFFELGGDSILTIQVVARASQAGLSLTPKQLFEAQTIAELAAVVGTEPAVKAEQGLVAGEVPLSPIQAWFFEKEPPDPDHWNQALMFRVNERLELEWVKETLAKLLEHHDALRMRFRQEPGGWRQVNQAPEGEAPLEWIDLSELGDEEQKTAIEQRAGELQRTLNFEMGPLLRAAYFDLGAGRDGRLLIIVHHLVVDGVSWRILLEDFQNIYRQLSRGEPVRLPPKTTSFRDWSRRLAEFAQGETLKEELDFWLEQGEGEAGVLPLDGQGRANREEQAHSIELALEEAATRALLQDVPAAYGTEINDVLLAALAQTLVEWTGKETVRVEMEGHGREEILDGVDLSRTVGWFTSLYPFKLKLKGLAGPGERLKGVKEQLRRIPKKGIGYGLLRYMSGSEEIMPRLKAQASPEVSFNYLGQVVETQREETSFKLAGEDVGHVHSPKGERAHVLEINGSISGGRLKLAWEYGEELHRRETIEKLARRYLEVLRELIAHCQSPEAGGYSPSDFPDIELSEEDIEAILEEIGGGESFEE